MTDSAAVTLIVFGALAFVAWIIWTLASGVLGITLGQILIYALFFIFGFVMGKGSKL